MAKRRTKKGSAMDSRLRIALVVGFLILLAYYLITGSDPLGLFRRENQPVAGPTAVTGQGSTWWTVYFTNPQRGAGTEEITGTVAEALVEQINAAQETIDIAVYELNLTPVAQAVIEAHNRGLQVRWFTDDEDGLGADAEEGHGQFAQLQAAGIPVRTDERSALMHNKFWVFDRQRVWTGSTNATVNDVFRNNNNVLLIDSPVVAAMYEREFAELWAGESGPTSPSTVDEQSTTIDGSAVQVYFAAEDEAISQLVPLVEAAQSQVRFLAFSFTHDDLGNALLARAEAGVDVQGIFETRGSETASSELPRLFCAGLPVRQDGNPRTFHHKVMIIDEAMVVTGSLNFSQNADDSNDENVIVVSNRDLAARYLQEFAARWTEATPPEAGAMGC
jgi:phosphatidylserine/phosphatidylglycerophosphate/cardiolipin synthase-like enzyme